MLTCPKCNCENNGQYNICTKCGHDLSKAIFSNSQNVLVKKTIRHESNQNIDSPQNEETSNSKNIPVEEDNLQCQGCNYPIIATALSCPNCGKPNPLHENKSQENEQEDPTEIPVINGLVENELIGSSAREMENHGNDLEGPNEILGSQMTNRISQINHTEEVKDEDGQEQSPRLIAVSLGNSSHNEDIEFDSEDLDLGRRIISPNDASLSSGRHVRIYKSNDEWILENHASNGAVFVQVTDQTVIKNGDTILLGESNFFTFKESD